MYPLLGRHPDLIYDEGQNDPQALISAVQMEETPRPMHVVEPTRRHILAVNDSVELLAVLQEFLAEEHYAVTTATFLTTTFDQIVTLAPTLLILDLVDGHQAAWDLLVRVGSEACTREMPILVTSTSQRVLDAAQQDHAQVNGQHYLRKPFDLDELLRIVTDVVDPA